MFYFNEGHITFLSILSPTFFETLLPWVNLSILFGIGVDIFKLWRGKRTRLVRLLEIGKDVLSAWVLYIFISNPPMFAISTELSGYEGLDALADLLNAMARIGFPILLVFTFIGIVKKSVDLMKAETVEL